MSSAAPLSPPSSIARLARPVFSVGDRDWSWVDVVTDAEDRGAVDGVRDEIRCAVAAVQLAEPLADDVWAASAAFRYARDLISGEEMEQWLEHWALTAKEWSAWVRRDLALRAHRPRPADIDVEQLVWPTVVCDGTLGVWARGLAARTAAGGADALERLRREAASPSAVEREIAGRHLDWLSVDLDALTFATEDAAREGILCLVDDGVPANTLAHLAGASAWRGRAYVGDLAVEGRAALRAATTGEVIGPIASDGAYVVYVVHAKELASGGDLELERRARALLAERAEQELLDERVRWHDDV